MKFDVKQLNTFGNLIQIPLPPQEQPEADKLMKAAADGKEITVEIKVKRKHRSLTANAYLWILAQKLAEELSKNGPITKEDIYREAIRKCGVKTITFPVPLDKVNWWIKTWNAKGVGWICENLRAAKTPGYTLIVNYPGSSCFNAEEMARLIDLLVAECKSYGIETRPQAEIESLINEWSEIYERNRQIGADA